MKAEEFILKKETVLEQKVVIVLSYTEVKALEDLFGYGYENFVKFFFKHMGRAYLEKHITGLYSLYQKVQILSGWASKAEDKAEVVRQMEQREKLWPTALELRLRERTPEDETN